MWVSAGAGAHELLRLGAADDPKWVAGGPGLLVERSGALWYLTSATAAPERVTPAFLPGSFYYYGYFKWSSLYALAPVGVAS